LIGHLERLADPARCSYGRDVTGIRIIVVTDCPMSRERLLARLRADRLAVVATADDAGEAFALVLEHLPDIALVDADIAGATDIVRRLVARLGEAVRVVVVADDEDPAEMVAAVRAGAVGYLAGEAAFDQMGAALRGVVRGEAGISRRMSRYLLADVRAGDRRSASAQNGDRRLTPRQLEILRLIANGSTTGEIARALYLSPDTVRWHVKAILRRLGARTRAEAASVLAEVGDLPTRQTRVG
jgi:DNA-binding NarL/FixJ family response regulator